MRVLDKWFKYNFEYSQGLKCELGNLKINLKLFCFYLTLRLKEREKNTINSSHKVLPAMPKGSAHTPLVAK